MMNRQDWREGSRLRLGLGPPRPLRTETKTTRDMLKPPTEPPTHPPTTRRVEHSVSQGLRAKEHLAHTLQHHMLQCSGGNQPGYFPWLSVATASSFCENCGARRAICRSLSHRYLGQVETPPKTTTKLNGSKHTATSN